jgi:hypothetical protein
MILMLVSESLFEPVFLKSQIYSDSDSTRRGAPVRGSKNLTSPDS